MENKTAFIFLIGAIFISIFGTFVTLNKISELQYAKTTGFALTDTGIGTIEIERTQSIIVNSTNNTIDFGICTGDNTNSAPYNLTSNSTNVSAWGNCSSENPHFPGFIEIINDGNSDVNLTVQSSEIATGFIGGNNPVTPLFGFITVNETGPTGDGGCNTRKDGGASALSTIDNWEEFQNGINHEACYNLTYDTTRRTTIKLYLMVQIPTNPTPGIHQSTLTFTANPFMT